MPKQERKPSNELKQSRNWVFTDFKLCNWNNIYSTYKDIIRFLAFGLETCPTTGKKHYQGWIQFTTKRTKGGVQRICKDNDLKSNDKTYKISHLHVEPMYGDEFDNTNYCSKEGKYTTYGKFLFQGQRTDLEMIRNLIANETPIKDIADDYFDTWCRNYKAFEKYREMVLQEKYKEFRKVEVIVLEGKTGQGKTRKAMEEATYKINADDLQWWDGYNGQKCILIDEYNNQVPITKILNLLDGYQLRLPFKGGHTYAYWNKVYITTNKNWDEWHPNAHEEHRKALLRRISSWSNLNNIADVGPQGNTNLRAGRDIDSIPLS